MATSTDEKKVQKALAEEVEEETPAEPEAQPENPETPPDEQPAEQPKVEEDKPAEAEEEPAPSTFTKPEGYEWLKGDTPEEAFDSLRVAYENSTAEALRLRQTAPAAPATPAPAPVVDPGIAYAQAMMQKDMTDSFEKFAKKYPQAREPQGFDQFQKASNGAAQAFSDVYGRLPTYPELFEKTAQLLSWQPSDKIAQQDAALKDTLSSESGQTTSPAPAKRVNVSQKQIDIARRIPGNNDKSDAELVKELQPYINQ